MTGWKLESSEILSTKELFDNRFKESKNLVIPKNNDWKKNNYNHLKIEEWKITKTIDIRETGGNINKVKLNFADKATSYDVNITITPTSGDIISCVAEFNGKSFQKDFDVNFRDLTNWGISARNVLDFISNKQQSTDILSLLTWGELHYNFNNSQLECFYSPHYKDIVIVGNSSDINSEYILRKISHGNSDVKYQLIIQKTEWWVKKPEEIVDLKEEEAREILKTKISPRLKTIEKQKKTHDNIKKSKQDTNEKKGKELEKKQAEEKKKLEEERLQKERIEKQKKLKELWKFARNNIISDIENT